MAFHIYRDTVGRWRWYLRDDNHRKIANCGGGFSTKEECIDSIRLVVGLDPGIPVYED